MYSCRSQVVTVVARIRIRETIPVSLDQLSGRLTSRASQFAAPCHQVDRDGGGAAAVCGDLGEFPFKLGHPGLDHVLPLGCHHPIECFDPGGHRSQPSFDPPLFQREEAGLRLVGGQLSSFGCCPGGCLGPGQRGIDRGVVGYALPECGEIPFQGGDVLRQCLRFLPPISDRGLEGIEPRRGGGQYGLGLASGRLELLDGRVGGDRGQVVTNRLFEGSLSLPAPLLRRRRRLLEAGRLFAVDGRLFDRGQSLLVLVSHGRPHLVRQRLVAADGLDPGSDLLDRERDRRLLDRQRGGRRLGSLFGRLLHGRRLLRGRCQGAGCRGEQAPPEA